VYRLATVTIPTNRPLQRHWAGERLFSTADEKWDAVVERIAGLHQRGRPVLVGTKSVSASELLSEKLTAAGIPHVILNARQDKEEADIVSKAGQPGRVTVATNMAGRGTDIKLLPEVAKAGGLHVLATERHEAGRIDRQLYGRSGRQGDPGSFETLVSLEDDLMITSRRLLWRWMADACVRRGKPLDGKLAAFLVRQAQLSAEALHVRIRRDLLQYEDQLETSLAFSGRLE
jgi:preprotein translocase subunit SecA